MSFGSKHARKEGLSFTFDTSHIQEYVTLCELNAVNKPGHVYPIRALFISKGKFGEHPTVALEDCYVNLPAWLTEECREIASDPEDVASINEGKAGFVIVEKTGKNGKYLSINWADC